MKIKFFISLIIAVFFLTSGKKSKSCNSVQTVNDTLFVRIDSLSNDFVYDMKYATLDNFLNEKVYNCSECYTRLIVAKNLIEANKDFMKLGYKIKFYDCYRPLDIQKKMWKIVPDSRYVANPEKGSIHNRGGAVDITLVDKNGVELDMGTTFDHFGIEASHNYKKLSKQVLKNRKLLKKIMQKHHFKMLETEWWHYNFDTAVKYKVSNFNWECN